MLDIAIIGGGPCGLAAGLKASTEGLNAAIFEASDRLGGRCASSPLIENIPGFDRGVAGPVYAETLRRQVERFGCRFRTGSSVQLITPGFDGTVFISVEHGDQLSVVNARTALICAGLTERQIPGLNGAARYSCDPAELREHRGKRLLFIGGGNSSVQLAIEAAEAGARATILARQPLVHNVSAYLLPRIKRAGVKVLLGDATLAQTYPAGTVVSYTTPEGKLASTRVDQVFAFPGGAADVPFFNGLKESDGRILTGLDADLDTPYLTSEPGIFAAGDVRWGNTGSIALAQGEGTAAVQTIARVWLPEQQLVGGVRPEARN